MKKTLLLFVVFLLSVSAFANNAKHKMDLPFAALYSTDDRSWRGGVAPLIHSVDYTDSVGNHTILGGNLLVFTNLDKTKNSDPLHKLYLGYGVSASFVNTRNFEFGVNLGWTADFADIQDPKDGKFGIGAHMTFRW